MRFKKTAVAAVSAAALALSSCGNMSVGFGNYTYNRVHVFDTAGNCCDLEIDKWYDNENGIEIQLKDGNNLYLSEGTYILIKDECPLCAAHK